MGTITSGSNLVDTISSIFLTYFVAAYVRRFKCNLLFLHSFNKQATINYTKRFSKRFREDNFCLVVSILTFFSRAPLIINFYLEHFFSISIIAIDYLGLMT